MRSRGNPDVYLYPDSDDNLFQSMQRETELLFDSIVRENRSVVDLLTADYTFVDERLATHYGIPKSIGPRFRRVTAGRSASRRPARPGQHPHAHVDAQPDVAGRARQVGARADSRVAPPPPPPVVPHLEENNVIGGEPSRGDRCANG